MTRRRPEASTSKTTRLGQYIDNHEVVNPPPLTVNPPPPMVNPQARAVHRQPRGGGALQRDGRGGVYGARGKEDHLPRPQPPALHHRLLPGEASRELHQQRPHHRGADPPPDPLRA
eukprot:7674506-Pyramimonas_sp.AAC.2